MHTASTSVLSHLVPAKVISSHKASWSPPSRLPTNRPPACSPTCTRRSTTSTRCDFFFFFPFFFFFFFLYFFLFFLFFFKFLFLSSFSVFPGPSSAFTSLVFHSYPAGLLWHLLCRGLSQCPIFIFHSARGGIWCCVKIDSSWLAILVQVYSEYIQYLHAPEIKRKA